MGSNEHQWYFDLGETSTEAENPDEIFGHSIKIATLEDIERGKADVPFEIMNERIEGLDDFTQNTVDYFVDLTALSPKEGVENPKSVEEDIMQAARERVDKVHSVTASQSDRDSDEIKVSMTVEAEGNQHETNFYLGSIENIDS